MPIKYLDSHKLPPSYYEATVDKRVEYPTLNTSLKTDIAIVGAGMAGLHTALLLAEHGFKVVVLEARRVGWGASGRNGGHLIPELACGMATIESALGINAAQDVWQGLREAASRIKQCINTYHITCDYQAGHIEAAITPRHSRHLEHWQAWAAKTYGQRYKRLHGAALQSYIGSKRYDSALLDEEGGHLHPLKLTLGLAEALIKKGGIIYENSPVQSWEEGGSIVIHTKEGQVSADRLILTSNVGIETIHTPHAQNMAKRILPVGTWIIATEPLTDDIANAILPTRAAVADNRVVLDYFRLSADNRLIFGGGCSYLGDGTPTGFADSLRQGMIKVFPELAQSRIDYAWGGVIDISMSRAPDVGQAIDTIPNPSKKITQPRIYHAQGFSGSGLVATAYVAGAIYNAIIGKGQRLEQLSQLKHRAFPGGALFRAPLTAMGMMWARAKDWV